ncbi:dTDP-4-dehydrorhamnose 3,5-epimerase family protein [Paracoccaceae bacterium]|nr:dTDP-4-dehydrorhamnose 3,5-epimerase family protein [Paracoccaceae bacterium]
MKFLPTSLEGLIEVQATPHLDARGSFARAFCIDEFRAAGIDFKPVQTSISTNEAFTLRGLHYRSAPNGEKKLVRAVTGRAFDVAVDLRKGSTFGQWHGVELSSERMNAIFVPEGFAHGFLALEQNTTLLYQISPAYEVGSDVGVRWDDPDIAIAWPAKPQNMSPNDEKQPFLSDIF